MIYYFILGRENKISQKELESVLASFGFGLKETDISIIAKEILKIKLPADSNDVAALMKILGGTVKIFEKIAPVNANIAELLKKEMPKGKLIFGLSNYSKNSVDVFKLALLAKKQIDRSIRIIAGKDNGRLSSAQSFQYKMDGKNIEYGIFDSGIGKLIAVQDIDDWTRRDYGKPRSDARAGMLPPKLARAMVNIAIGQAGIKNYELGIMNENQNSEFIIHNSCLVVDPFCGSGNVLIEALSVGCDVIGADISEKAVEDTKANLEWLIQKLKIKNQNDNVKFKISRQDATEFDFLTIDRDFVIVSEPFLGAPRNAKLRIEEEKEVKDEILKLYQNFFRNLVSQPSKLKAAVIVFPLFELANGGKLSIFENCVDFLEKNGYDIVCPPMRYGREYQIVKREIILLKQE